MKNWKKVGLTALAGSLVATSAFAGAVSVTGTANLTYARLMVVHKILSQEIKLLVRNLATMVLDGD